MVQVELDVDWGRAAWIGFGAALALSVLFVLHSFVGTVVFGLFFYYATRRFYRRIRRRVGQRSVSAALALLLLALPALALLLYTLSVGLRQLNDLAETLDGGELSAQFGPALSALEETPQVAAAVEDPVAFLTGAGGVGAATGTLQVFAGYLAELGTGLLHLFVMFAIAFYLLRDAPRLSRWSRQFADEHGVLEHYAREVDRSLDKVFYGNILNAIITGIVGAVVYSLLNLIAPAQVRIPYAVLFGLLTGAASLIPVVGMKLVYVPIAIYLAAAAVVGGEGWLFVALFVGVSFLVVDVIPDLVVRPYVSGGNIHVGSLMFAYILGPLLFGWYGIFLGPILLVLVVHFVRIILPELLAGTRIQPYAVDPSNVVGEPEPKPAVPTDGGDEPEGDGDADGTDPAVGGSGTGG